MVASSTALTRREWEVLSLLAEGKRPAEVADILIISLHTVRGYVKTIRYRLNASTNEHAVYLAFVSTSAKTPNAGDRQHAR